MRTGGGKTRAIDVSGKVPASAESVVLAITTKGAKKAGGSRSGEPGASTARSLDVRPGRSNTDLAVVDLGSQRQVNVAGNAAKGSASVRMVVIKQASPQPRLGVSGRLTLDLNPQQAAAVTHRGGPILMVAGAGSARPGADPTHRHLLATGQAVPSEILAITFTNKAATEMKERVTAAVGPVGQRMWVSTFHSASVCASCAGRPTTWGSRVPFPSTTPTTAVV